jgi:hypothetical protein
MMKREIAESIIKAMKAVDLAIDQLDPAVRAIPDEAERHKMLMFIGRAIHDFHVQITLPVVKHHPDLHPDLPYLSPPKDRSN